MVADIANPFSVAVLRGAEKAAQQAGYLVMLFNLGNASEREREAIEALASYQVEGFILNTLGADPDAAREVARHGKPAVLVDRRQADMRADFVSLDNADAVRSAVAHLQQGGWRELLYVTEPVAGVSSRQERVAAFEAAVAAAGKGRGRPRGTGRRPGRPGRRTARVEAPRRPAAGRRGGGQRARHAACRRGRRSGWAGASGATSASSVSMTPSGRR